MHAEIRTVRDPETRVRVVEERSAFDQNPEECLKANEEQLNALKKSITDAQELLSSVELDYELRVKISQVCGSLDVDGLRGDIVTNRAAKAYAAYNGRSKVTVEDIEKALTAGVKAFEPGLLAKANRGILYVDEVNLLDDHLVDILLDSAASGWNTVEREGISIKHPARFVLVGSGNPEEGELRPQLLDRFGMHAEIRTVRDPETRVRVVEERSNFDKNPEECLKANNEQLEALKKTIVDAQELLPSVELDYELRVKISQVCGSLDVDGLRGDIVTNRAAKAYAAYNQRSKVTVDDIETVITLCLRHRLRKDPLESIDSGDKVSSVFEEVFK
jgi:Mg-chelatase subunit ChlI